MNIFKRFKNIWVSGEIEPRKEVTPKEIDTALQEVWKIQPEKRLAQIIRLKPKEDEIQEVLEQINEEKNV